jgi:hypothetical protein
MREQIFCIRLPTRKTAAAGLASAEKTFREFLIVVLSERIRSLPEWVYI